MEDVLPEIYAIIDDALDIANMYFVSRGWRSQYAYCAAQLCKRRFTTWLSVVNVPVTAASNMIALIRRPFHRCSKGRTNACHLPDNNTFVKWLYPFSPKFPDEFFDQLVSNVPLFRTLFRHFNLDGIVGHMCITPNEEEYNAFTSPQEWFPFYYKDGAVFGVNVGHRSPSVIGIAIYLEEQSTNRVTDIGTALDIIHDWETVADDSANGFVFADRYLHMLDLDSMELIDSESD